MFIMFLVLLFGFQNATYTTKEGADIFNVTIVMIGDSGIYEVAINGSIEDGSAFGKLLIHISQRHGMNNSYFT